MHKRRAHPFPAKAWPEHRHRLEPGSAGAAPLSAGEQPPARARIRPEQAYHVAAPSWAYRAGKRLFDLVIAALLLVGLAPLFPIIALLIKLDSPGPIFFVQCRVGQYGRCFGMLKFRSMVAGAHAPLRAKPVGDPRITRVGRWLRRTSLDELPQLINVIRGQMSLVGPRPEIVELVAEHYQPWQYRRFAVPQGMTGWWQVTGRGRKTLLEHTEDDLYYIEHASFWFDLQILVRTIPAVLWRDGAF